MNKWIAEFDLEDGDTMPEHMDLNYMGAQIDFHCRPMWIPCSERLPSHSERIVLATVVRRDKTWNNDPYHRLVTYSQGKWYPVPQSINLVPCRMATIEQSDGGQAEVIAWMPLPETYREEEMG